MKTECPATALFVALRGAVQPGGGGVQWCTREYRTTLAAAGVAPHDFAFEADRSLRARVLRVLRPRPFDNSLSRGLAERVLQAAHHAGTDWIFLNNTAACALAPELRHRHPQARLVFLSHGAEITDVVNNLRLTPGSLPAHQHLPAWLGYLLTAEMAQRAALDAVVVISQPDAEVERWLGAKNILFLPRQVTARHLPLVPVAGRVGCVATLDHGPNRHGLELLAAVLDRFSDIELRLVGAPESAGRDLAARFRAIRYCGRLDDRSLEAEAATWRAFVNPIFCPARGASTKVATALGWGLPVLTTPDGARGYEWSEQALPLATTPADLADLIRRAAHDAEYAKWQEAASTVTRRAPDQAASAARLRRFLDDLTR